MTLDQMIQLLEAQLDSVKRRRADPQLDSAQSRDGASCLIGLETAYAIALDWAKKVKEAK